MSAKALYDQAIGTPATDGMEPMNGCATTAATATPHSNGPAARRRSNGVSPTVLDFPR